MKTILVLSSHPDFAETIRAGLNAEQYRIVHRLNVDEAEPLIVHGLASAIILDAAAPTLLIADQLNAPGYSVTIAP